MLLRLLTRRRHHRLAQQLVSLKRNRPPRSGTPGMDCPAANAFGLVSRVYQVYLRLIDTFIFASSYIHSLLRRVSPFYSLHYRQTFRSSHTGTLQRTQGRFRNDHNFRGALRHDRPRYPHRSPLLCPLFSVKYLILTPRVEDGAEQASVKIPGCQIHESPSLVSTSKSSWQFLQLAKRGRSRFRSGTEAPFLCPATCSSAHLLLVSFFP